MKKLYARIYEFLNQNSNPIENKKIKLLNTILKTISIPNYPELCYCILNVNKNIYISFCMLFYNSNNTIFF